MSRALLFEVFDAAPPRAHKSSGDGWAEPDRVAGPKQAPKGFTPQGRPALGAAPKAAAPPSAEVSARAALAETAARHAAEDARRLAKIRGEARAEGYAEGVATAEAQAHAALRIIAAELREGLQDALQTAAEQEASMERRLRDFAEALLGAAAPALARAGLAAEIAEAVGAALHAGGSGVAHADDLITVRVSPDQADAARIALAEAGFAAPVAADPTLGPLRAELDWAGGADRIDLAAALEAAREAVDRHLTPTARIAAHG
ncbi:MAG: hypothetical protein AAFU61_16550 [Pseudomonadota bacterium]